MSELPKCECGHSSACHMQNLTGEMFGSTLEWCSYCKCKEWRPVDKKPVEQKGSPDAAQE